MKNYKVFLGIAALALVFGLVFTGCSDPTQVEGDVGRYTVAHGPSIDAGTLTVVKGTGTAGTLIVNFKPADNATSYTVYYSPDKKVIAGNTSTVTIGNGLNANGTPTITTGIPDYTKASASISISGSSNTTAYYIGVRAQDVLTNYGDIVWSAAAVAAR